MFFQTSQTKSLWHHHMCYQKITITPYLQTDVNDQRLFPIETWDFSTCTTTEKDTGQFWNGKKKRISYFIKRKGVKETTRGQFALVVHIHDDMLPRMKWKSVAGNDGLVRAVVVRTSTPHTMIPVMKIYPTEVNAKSKTDFVLCKQKHLSAG